MPRVLYSPLKDGSKTELRSRTVPKITMSTNSKENNVPPVITSPRTDQLIANAYGPDHGDRAGVSNVNSNADAREEIATLNRKIEELTRLLNERVQNVGANSMQSTSVASGASSVSQPVVALGQGDTNTGTSGPSNVNAHSAECISQSDVQFQPLWRHDVEGWFSTLELLFENKRINSDQLMYCNLLKNMGEEAQREIQDELKCLPRANKYQHIKKAVLRNYSLSTAQRLTKLTDN